jgi:hypothetical protein
MTATTPAQPLPESRPDTDSSTPVNPFQSRDSMDSDDMSPESQLSPRFLDYLRAKTAMNEDIHEIPETPSAGSPDHTFDYRQSTIDQFPIAVETARAPSRTPGSKASHTVSPVDGKTEDCNRRHTFDAFVNQQQIRSEIEPEKRVGHGWQVFRALKKVAGSRKSRMKPKHVGVQAQQIAT